MLPPLPPPSATLAETEIEVPALAARYAAAIGEPVAVPAPLKHRAVAVFVRNVPWDRVMALAGEAAGFGVERRGSDLHLKSTRSFSLESLEKEAAARMVRYRPLPADVLTALPAYLAADGALDRELARKPRDPARVAEARRRREALIGVSSPQRLVLARFLSRGGTLPIGRTVLVRFGDYVKPREYAIYSTWTEDKPVPQFAAFRANDSEIEIALDPEAVDRTLYAWAEPLPIAPEAKDETEERERATTRRDLAAIPWTKTTPPLRSAPNGYGIGDILGWIHRATGRPAVGVAPRLALPAPSENLVSALLDGPVRMHVRDGAFLTTTRYGDGLWPHDFGSLDELKSPTLGSLSTLCASASPMWEALLSREYGGISGRFGFEIRSGLPVLRLLGGATPAGLARFRSEESVAVASLDAGTAAAAWRYLVESSSPTIAVRRGTRGSTTLRFRFSEREVTEYATPSGARTSVEDVNFESEPDLRRRFVAGLPPEYTLTAPGLSDRVLIHVGDEESDVQGASVTRTVGEEVPLKRTPGSR